MVGATLLVSCSPGDRLAVDGVIVLDEDVALERGEQRDAANREIAVDRDSIFVAFASEDDADVRLRLSHSGVYGTAPANVEVESFMLDAGLEIAVFDAPRGSRLRIDLTGPLDFERPRTIPLEIWRYEVEAAKDPRTGARIAALRAWTAATDATLSGADIEKKSIPHLDTALGILESENGDPSLAAWARVLRSRFNYRRMADLKVAMADARQAQSGFAALGDARNAARASFLAAVAMLEIATNTSAVNPSAEEAGREATRLLNTLRHEPALSDFERARCVGYLGANYFNLQEWAEARVTFRAALSSYEKVGYRHGRRQVLTNLGVLSAENGEYRAATRYFDLVMPEIDQVGVGSQRVMILYNAAAADNVAGNTDRAIDRLLQAQAIAHTLELKQYESLILYGLGRAYWMRGDFAQATTLLGEALKLRRTLDGGIPLLFTLRTTGALARETGDFTTAIAMHREGVSLAYTPQMKLFALLELTLDYMAQLDYERAIAISRQALAIRFENLDFHKRADVQLALANALLSRPARTPDDLDESQALIREALAAAARRSDTTMELAARRLLARSLKAKLEYGEAREEYERAISLIFRYRSTINNPELRAAILVHEQQTLRGYVDLLMRDVVRRGPARLMPASVAEENALRTLEWWRALKADVAAGAERDAGTQARISDLLTEMAGKRVRIAALLEREKPSTRQLEVLQLDIARLRAEVDRLRAPSSNHANGPNLSPTVGANFADLPEGVTQLSYVLDAEHPYLWVRDASGIRTTMLAARGDAITRDLAALDDAVRARAPARVEAVLMRMSNVLLPAGALAEEVSTLEVVADGNVARIPFAALTSLDGKRRRLAERQSVILINSFFKAPKLPARTRVLQFAALASGSRPTDETPAAQVFSSLQGPGAESREIAALFRARDPKMTITLMYGADGSSANLKKVWVEGVDVFHFATHALADPRQPLTSLLLLPALDAAGASTYLTAGQVQEWRGDADLVYLSACDTAVGNGMQGAFLRAGARGVVATLWPVEDVYASQFAVDFYRRYTAGMPASQALSETQRAWMVPAHSVPSSEQAYRGLTAWTHVYFAQ